MRSPLPEALLAGALALAPAAAAALDGLVLLPDGTPAGDATVSILGRTGATRTGPDGRFRWVPDPTTPFDVLVILPGGVYALPVSVEELPEGGGPVTLRLRLAAAESVTVDAGATPHTEAPPASAATVVLAHDLEQRRPDSLAEAIEFIPGVGRLEEGHTAVPSIRGLARGRTLILLDGARVTAERRAGPSGTFLDPFFLEAVEVSRGFGAVAYGSDAFGGVIHARTRQAVPGSPWQGRAEGTVGAGVPERSLGVQVTRGFEEGGLIVQTRYRDFDDYQSPRGRVGNSSFRDAGFRARLDHEVGPGRLSVSVQTDLGRDIGKPAQDSGVTRAFYPREDAHRIALGYEGDPQGGLSRWSLQAVLGRYRLVTDRDRSATKAQPRQVGRSDVRAWDYGVRASGAAALLGFRVEGGLDVNGRTGLEALGAVESYDSTGRLAEVARETSVADASRHDAALYVAVDGRLRPRLTAAAGARLDRVGTQNHGGFFGEHETSRSATSGFGALTAGPFWGITATGQVGRGFRDPTLSDRYFRGVGGRGFVTGRPDLGPERSLQYDLALRRAGPVRTALYLYRYRISDLVERYRDGSDFFFRNRGRAEIEGLELEAQAKLGGGFTVELGAQAARGRASDDDTPLADVPAEGATLTVRKGFARGGAFLRVVLRDRDEDAGPTETATPGYGVLDAGATWNVRTWLQVRGVVKNVLDRDYAQTPDELAAPAPGRSVALTAAATF